MRGRQVKGAVPLVLEHSHASDLISIPSGATAVGVISLAALRRELHPSELTTPNIIP